MKKIQIALKDFPVIPFGLFDDKGNQVQFISFSPKEIYVHYWIAKYGDHSSPPLEAFEFMHQISSCSEWRMKGDGIGIGTEAKRNISNELAKGFARWFMYTYLGFTYFTPFEHAVKAPPDVKDGHRWVKVGEGDAPDYVCGSVAADVNILEVKGRYDSVTFDTKEFENFREQVARARLLNEHDQEIAVKSFIFAARWATENHPNVQPKLWVEDPWTPGSQEIPKPNGLGSAMIRGHYADLLRRMGFYRIATALQEGIPFESTEKIFLQVWKCIFGRHSGRLFVALNLIPGAWQYTTRPLPSDMSFPWVHPFLGLDLDTFIEVVSAARVRDLAPEIRQVFDGPIDQTTTTQFEQDDLVLLRDGVVAGAIQYFIPFGPYEINELPDRERFLS